MGTLAAGATIVCPVSYVTPGTAGGTDTTPVSVTLTGTTSATNDSNAANNTAPVTRTIIDAVNDSASQPGGTLGATTNVATNDQFPASSLFSVVTGGSCANASVSGTGTATYDVPASGTCTVNYQVCAPAPNTTVCDTAILNVTAGAADMSVTQPATPIVSAPGSTVNTSITCTASNVAPNSTAIAPTCGATAVNAQVRQCR
ncbi:MAG: hypothetical protein IPN04_11655 [Rhodoferax sp.]|nr:hypothetical protein [Rhodoferax sp.]